MRVGLARIALSVIPRASGRVEALLPKTLLPPRRFQCAYNRYQFPVWSLSRPQSTLTASREMDTTPQAQEITLIIALRSDPASIGQANALLKREGWLSFPPVEDNEAWSNKQARLWVLSGARNRLISDDHLDTRWLDATGEHVAEVIFMSRHVAASGKPALTVHPIGVPHATPGDTLLAGGTPGWAAPPCVRLGAWLRLLDSVAKSHGLTPEFEVTLEATHHGPTMHSPAMFVEIGSTEDYWGREDAAAAMADVFTLGLGLGDQDEDRGHGDWAGVIEGTPVLVGIGGGHYAPRHADLVRKGEVWLGHLISGYSLPMSESEGAEVAPVEGGLGQVSSRWRHVIRTAVGTTQRAFPGGRVMVHLDAKSLKGWQKAAITEFCKSENIPIGKPSDFLSLAA